MDFKVDKTIAPIPTRYNGYHFRSRLEARYGVFFDALGLNWEYEVEGYDLGNLGWYLPDFVITSPYGNKHIYEIKPNDSSKGTEKLNKVLKYMNAGILRKDDFSGWIEPSDALLHSGSVLYGDPFENISRNIKNKMIVCPRCGLIQMSTSTGSDYDWIGCTPCDFQTPGGHDNPLEESVIFKGVKYIPYKGTIALFDQNELDKFNKILIGAALKSRSARFEHGESGAT